MFDLDGEVFLWNLCWHLPKGREILGRQIQVNAENLSVSFTVSLSLGLPLFGALFSFLSIQSSCFGTLGNPETHICYTWLQLRINLNFQTPT